MATIKKDEKDLKYYLTLKYPIEIVEDEGSWSASIPDLPGCNSFGATVTDAVQNIEEAKELWLESQIQSGGEVPEPTEEDEFSGRFVLRIPRILHRNLAYEARKQSVSLNHYVSHLLSQRHPLAAFEHFAQSLFDSCRTLRAPGLFARHWHDKSLMVGKLNANTDLLVYLRKPAAAGQFKTSISEGMRRQYLPEKT